MRAVCKLGVAMMMAGACAALATSLPPGSSGGLSLGYPPSGSIVASLSSPFSAPTFGGTLVSTVWSGDIYNPFGGLTFTYQLSNSSGSLDPIDRFTLSSYLGFQADASYFGAGIIPTNVVRNPSGNQISFNFSGPLEGVLSPGTTSTLLIIHTSSTGYQSSLAGIINSSTVNVGTFAPLAVPEPTAAVLVLVGALSLAVRRKS